MKHGRWLKSLTLLPIPKLSNGDKNNIINMKNLSKYSFIWIRVTGKALLIG